MILTNEELIKAIKWLLENQPTNYIADKWDVEAQRAAAIGERIYSAPGCSCCSNGYIKCPEEIKETLDAVSKL